MFSQIKSAFSSNESTDLIIGSSEIKVIYKIHNATTQNPHADAIPNETIVWLMHIAI